MQIFVNKNLQYVKVIALAAPLTCHLCDFAFVDGTARAPYLLQQALHGRYGVLWYQVSGNCQNWSINLRLFHVEV